MGIRIKLIVVRPFPRAEPRIHRRVWVKTLVLASTLCQLLPPPRKQFQYQLAATEPLTPNLVTSTPGHSNTQRIIKPPVLPFLLAVTDEVTFLKQCLGKNVINAPRTIRRVVLGLNLFENLALESIFVGIIM